jgi:hypothetical protein
VAYCGHDSGGIWVHRTLQVYTIVTLILFIVIYSVLDVSCWWRVCCAVASGLHWQFFCRRFQFWAGCSNSHMWDRYVQLVEV